MLFERQIEAISLNQFDKRVHFPSAPLVPFGDESTKNNNKSGVPHSSTLNLPPPSLCLKKFASSTTLSSTAGELSASYL